MFDLTSKIQVKRIIGNPPYNRHLMKLYWKKLPRMKAKVENDIGFGTQYPHIVMIWLGHRLLVEGGTAHWVLPSNWMTLPSYFQFRYWLKRNFIIRKLHIFDNSKKQVFDINMGDVVVLHLEKCSKQSDCIFLNKNVTWQYNLEEPFKVDVIALDIIPLYEKAIDVSIIDKICKNKTQNLCDRTKTKYFIEGPILGLNKSLEHSKTWLNCQEHTAGTKFTMYFDYKNDCDNHFQWYHTPAYNFALSLIKSSQKQQPATLDYIGYQDLKKLNFSKNEMQRIQRWRP